MATPNPGPKRPVYSELLAAAGPRSVEQRLLEIERSDATSTLGRAVRLVARGEIDRASISLFAGELDRVIETGVKVVLVDAVDVSFMDSSGLNALVTAARRLAATGGTLSVDAMSNAVRRVIQVTELMGILGPKTESNAS